MQPTLIITRPAPAGADFATSVQQAFGAQLQVIDAPALQIVPIPYTMPDAAHVIFTSARAVAVAPPGRGMPAWCVGGATAAAAKASGYVVHNADGDADALVTLIQSYRPKGAMVHLAGRHRRGGVAARLTASGLPCKTIEIYDQIALPVPQALIDAAADHAPLVAPVFSPRSAQPLLDLTYQAPLHVVAISAGVAALFRQISAAHTLTVGHPDADHMRDMTVAVLRSLDPLAE